MLPKRIHYCWFGGNKKPKLVKKCIESWKKFCPNYEIIEWNESNYDINKNLYVKTAYENKKWAFLTDYVRLDVIYNYGGIYLDTDVEMIKSLDELLNNNCYMGMEQIADVATGLGFGAIKNHWFIKENKEFYENENNFIDENKNFKQIICVNVTTDLLKKKGLKNENKIQKIDDIIIYPPEYLCGYDIKNDCISISDNTYTIHHYNASWMNKSEQKKIKIKKFIFKIIDKKKYQSIIRRIF